MSRTWKKRILTVASALVLFVIVVTVVFAGSITWYWDGVCGYGGDTFIDITVETSGSYLHECWSKSSDGSPFYNSQSLWLDEWDAHRLVCDVPFFLYVTKQKISGPANIYSSDSGCY